MTAPPITVMREGLPMRGADREALLRLFSSRIGWPIDPVLQARAELLGAREPRSPASGVVGLVSCTQGSNGSVRSALWTTTEAHEQTAVPFVRHAAQAHQLARRLVLTGLPVLAPRGPLERRRDPVATRVWRSGDGSDAVLDGRSFGLAFAIAEVSRVLDVPARAEILATAVVEPSGALGAVAHLTAKIRVVLEAGLGITKLLVAAEQKRDAMVIAEQLGRELGRTIAIAGAATLAEALDEHVFDQGVADAWIARCAPPETRRETNRAVFDLAIRGAPMAISWRGVARAASALAARSDTDEERTRAEIAALVARRHAGDRSCRIPWDDGWLDGLRRPLRLRAIAHVVQSATDTCDDDWERDAQRAATVLAPERDETTEDLELAGALGRAYASWARDEIAWSFFERAVRGWLELREEERASYSLSALLALASVMPADSRRDAFCEETVAVFDRCPRVNGMSRSFVGEARARMLEARGRIADANAALEGSTSADEPPHLRGMRARTRARIARRAIGGSVVDRAVVHCDDPALRPDQRLLIELDARLHASEDASDLLEALRRDSFAGAYIARIERTAPGPIELAVQQRFPY